MIPMSAVRNIRFGLATNSSSTHSIIFAPEIKDDIVDGYIEEYLEFDRSDFMLATPQYKRRYLKANLLSKYPTYSESILYLFDDDIFQDIWPEIDRMRKSAVDHNSTFPIPKEWSHGGVNIAFYSQFTDYIANHDFVIVGGSDEDDFDIAEGVKVLPKESYAAKFMDDDIAYSNGNYWVVINKNRKMRVAFHDERLIPREPELIDLKITSSCSIGCDYCYQDSGLPGKHADIADVMRIIDNIFNPVEIAIGGGEPTEYPHFEDVIRYASKNGKNKVNFTTKSILWMNDPHTVATVMKYVSGVAYSVDTYKSVLGYMLAHTEKLPTVDMYIHIIPELVGDDEVVKIFQAIDNARGIVGVCPRVTLLGYKTTGRAGDDIPYSSENLMNKIKHFNIPIGADTVFMSRYEDSLSVNKKLYTLTEGEFSMYIDAVEGKAYKSSYELDYPVPILKENKFNKTIGKVFKEVRDEALK